MRIMKFTPAQILRQPKQALLALERETTERLQTNRSVDIKAFSRELHDIGEAFVYRSEVECLNKHGKRFAEMLVALGDSNLAGIVYSLIIRLNPKQVTIVDQVATKALAIAKRFHDPVHIMARANDLKEIYKISKPGGEDHLRRLQTEKRALNDICTNYEGVKKRYKSLRHEMKPVGSYELKLAAIRFEIAEILKNTNKNEAIKELLEAQKLLEKHGKGRLSTEIEKLLAELKI